MRLGIPDDWPVAVQQWNNLIAVNYEARKRGVDRHASYKECLQKCPELRFVHVPTYSIDNYSTVNDGNDVVFGGCNNNSDNNNNNNIKNFTLTIYPATDRTSVFCPDRIRCKASLQPYREASLKIFEELRNFLSRYPGTILEKAGLDECFIDVTSAVNSAGDDVELKLHGKLAISSKGGNDNDDDKFIIKQKDKKLIHASMIAAEIREHIYKTLKYRVSAGVAKNKLLSKLGSATNKPNNQTVILEDHIQPFLKDLPITKLRSLGGKMGIKLVEGLPPSSTCSSLWKMTREELAERLPGSPDTIGEWTFNFVRGIDPSTVEDRSMTKSFLSVKNFLRPLTNLDILHTWTSLLFHELSQRVLEEKKISNRWPRSLSIKWTTKTVQKSKSIDFPLQPSDIPDRNPIMVDGICRILQTESGSSSDLFPLQNLSLGIHNLQHSQSIKRIDSFKLHKVDPWERDRISRVADCNLSSFNGFNGNGSGGDSGDSGVDVKQPLLQSITNNNKRKKTKNNKTIDVFLKRADANANDDDECWICPKCQKRIALDWMKIEEHENMHLAQELVIGTWS